MGIRVAVDIGGTFTDLVAVDETSGERARAQGLELADRADRRRPLASSPRPGSPAGDVSLFVHGTTVATNALIERDGTRVAFVTNRGFRDVIFIQNGTGATSTASSGTSRGRSSPATTASRSAAASTPTARSSPPLDDDDVEAVVAHLRAEGIRSVAIGLVFAQVNPDHELELEARLRAAIPDLAISLSHGVYPRWRENDRWQTVVADAYLKPHVRRATSRNLEGGLEETGVDARLVLMK